MTAGILSRMVGMAVAGWAVTAQPGLAQTASPVVVELFTSQGCSACPPADALLAKLADDPNIIALALHVDYWDYIGWTDTFGQARFTERQKAYAHAEGSRMVYTPQIIIGGRERVAGHDADVVASGIARRMASPSQVTLLVVRKDGRISIHAETAAPFARSAKVQLVHYLDQANVDIESGENAESEIVYRNIVTDWQVVGEWNGRAALDMQLPIQGDEGTVVIIQAAGMGDILAAARAE